MPRFDFKVLQGDLDQGLLWPFYWVYGPEKFNVREVLSQIRIAALGKTTSDPLGWNEEVLDGSEVEAHEILDAVQSPVLGGGLRCVVVKDAHLCKNLDILIDLLGPARPKAELESVCIGLAKDLDGRKKFSKILLEKAAVIPCDAIPDDQKEAWASWLAKRRGVQLNAELLAQLCAMDPWSLDILNQELEKFYLSELQGDVLLQHEASSFGMLGGADAFIESFFSKNFKAALSQLSSFASSSEEALPLLGWLGWNTRQLALLLADREQGVQRTKFNPHLAEKLDRWSEKWTLTQVIELQKELSYLDFNLKQTPLLPLGLWTHLLIQSLS